MLFTFTRLSLSSKARNLSHVERFDVSVFSPLALRILLLVSFQRVTGRLHTNEMREKGLKNMGLGIHRESK
jgi:hypothetical protein